MSFTSESNQGVSLNLNGNTYVFHSQWLKDACFENESSRDAASVYVHRQEPIVITSAKVQGEGSNSRLSVTWKDGSTNNFPIPWLLALAPLVGKQVNPSPSPTTPKTSIPPGWLAKQVDIQELPYDKLIASDISPAEYASTQNWLLDTLLSPACPGILKVTNLPPVDPLIESSQKDNLLTVLLKHLFGAVFQHSKRGPDETFKIASYYKDKITSRIEELPNYDVSEILLPHVDHAHYDNPVRVQGLHSIQGESENTFIDGWAVLQTLKDEDPEAYEILGKSPMVLGRVAQFYDPPLFQTTVDTAIRPTPGFPNLPKAVRWHPHLQGYLLTPFDEYNAARRAQCKFQEIMRRDTHQLKVHFKPGDMYLWDNFRLLHGREKIFSTPRLAVGQTVIEQVVSDTYREVKMAGLRKSIGEGWLVQCPTSELEALEKIAKKMDEDLQNGKVETRKKKEG